MTREDHERAARIIERVAPAPLVRRDWAARLIAQPRRVDKELAATILAPIAHTHVREVHRAFERLAGDGDAAVRAAAARLARPLVEDGLGALRAERLDGAVLAHVRALAADASPIVRQVARSTVKAIAVGHPELAELLSVPASAER